MAATTTTKLSSFSSPRVTNPNPNPKLSLFPHTLKPFHPKLPHRAPLAAAPKPSPLAATSSSSNPLAADLSVADEKPREECGVVGIYGDPDAARLCYLALHSLQHRGQEGAGIVSVSDDAVLHSVTGVGLVSDVFSETKLAQLPGSAAIGHVRYSTAGASMLKNVQPFVAGYRFGSVGVAHNGNLVNYNTLRHSLEDSGSIFNTSSDTEVVLHLIAISKHRPFLLRIVDACEQLQGAEQGGSARGSAGFSGRRSGGCDRFGGIRLGKWAARVGACLWDFWLWVLVIFYFGFW